mmetsp:Transcript_59641/g.141144  ORF Transcript_59641/g.141144 Transcript_59641/m.141144 type:complete len:108 (-) Transcript_59641:67-390(-)
MASHVAVDEQSGYSFDCFLPDISLVVEFDGPHHFAQGSKLPMGATVMKHRHVRSQGLGLVVVNYWEWSITGSGQDASPAEQEALLQSKIDAVLQRRREAADSKLERS